MLKKLLREPLVHFLLLGGLLFVYYSMSGPQGERPDEVIVTQGKIDNLIDLWIKTRQRPPTQQELRGLIDDYVIEEILYREARALGLDEDDTVIRRRLRQKMEFIAEDLADIGEPTEAELRSFLEENGDRFRRDAYLSFQHVFFNVDRRGEGALEDAGAVLSRLRAGYGGDPVALGDGLPLPFDFEAISSREIAGMFGPDFANELLTLPVGEWSGPIPSGFGLHLIKIDALEPGRDPRLAEVRDAVAREWSADRRERLKEEFYDSFKERYTVIVETPDSEEGTGVAAP